MSINFLIVLIAALVPMLTGFVWYNPKVFGNAWMKASNTSPEQPGGTNMALIFVLTFVFSFLFALAMEFVVIHQWHIYSIFANDAGMKDPNSEVGKMLSSFMENYGNNFRTFKHGAFHGTIAGIFTATPIITINALFERKGFKYIAINAGFWIVNMALIGGIICAYN